VQIERNLGADVIMQFDHVIPGQSTELLAREASERSVRWLERCLVEFRRLSASEAAEGIGSATAEDAGEAEGAEEKRAPGRGASREPLNEGLDGNSAGAATRRQALFPILQGGVHAQLRREAGAAIAGMADWAGFGIGGLSVGEPKPEMYAMIEVSDEALPRDRPRYLMGVGFPEDLVEAVGRGVDLFDCVAPTRMGRNGTAFTAEGRLNVRRAELRADPGSLDGTCGCSTCARFSRAYIRHLFMADEMLGASLLSLHNVHFLVALMRDARAAIRTGAFAGWSREWLARYHSRPAPVP
jgi:queuine tRNA-ribosyltransferase